MNSTVDSKCFVPLSQQIVNSSDKVLPISVHIVDEQPISQQIPVSDRSPDQYSGRWPELQPCVGTSCPLHTPPRPTTLSVCSPILPEFSISPADSLSKASSSDNIPESSTTPATGQPQFGQQLCAKQSLSSKSSPSPTTLSVHNFNCFGNYYVCGGSTPLALSPSFNSLQRSLASSINDLTVKVEQLEHAIRHNNTRFVRRMLELHNKSVNFSYDKTDSLIDKVSISSQNLDLDANNQNNKQMLKSQSMIEKFASNNNNCAVDRRESASADERVGESPSIFTNSLHLAIENNSYDVALLLRSGIDQNESGVQPYSMETWRRGSHASSDESCAPINATTNLDRLTINNVNLINSQSREPLIRTPSIRSNKSAMLLIPMAGPSHLNTAGAGAGSSLDINAGHNSIYFALNSSPSSINSELSSIGRFSTPVKVIRIRTDMWPNLKVVHMGSYGSGVTYDEEYTRENLYSLPPI